MRQTFFILHGSIVHSTGTFIKGETVDLDFFEAKYPLSKGIVKRYEPNIDKVTKRSEDPSRDLKGRQLPSLDEYKAAGFSEKDYDAFVAAARQADAEGSPLELQAKGVAAQAGAMPAKSESSSKSK